LGDLARFRFWFHSVHFARIRLVMHVYTCIDRFMHDTAKNSITQGLSQKRSPIATLGASSNPQEVLLHPKCTQILLKFFVCSRTAWHLTRRSIVFGL